MRKVPLCQSLENNIITILYYNYYTITCYNQLLWMAIITTFSPAQRHRSPALQLLPRRVRPHQLLRVPRVSVQVSRVAASLQGQNVSLLYILANATGNVVTLNRCAVM